MAVIKIINKDCVDYLQGDAQRDFAGRDVILVSDPPFNVGYHYGEYKDNKNDDEYYEWIKCIAESHQFNGIVFIHYPESLYRIASKLGKFPNRVVSWVYNSNTPRQHRDIAFFDVKPGFSQVVQPYKNPNDSRIAERIENGIKGGALYDWFYVNQIKNTNKGEFNHPCIMPLEVMSNVVGVLPKGCIVFDPFTGSGTTAIACKKLGYDFIGCEIDKNYCEMAIKRVENYDPDDGNQFPHRGKYRQCKLF